MKDDNIKKEIEDIIGETGTNDSAMVRKIVSSFQQTLVMLLFSRYLDDVASSEEHREKIKRDILDNWKEVTEASILKVLEHQANDNQSFLSEIKELLNSLELEDADKLLNNLDLPKSHGEMIKSVKGSVTTAAGQIRKILDKI